MSFVFFRDEVESRSQLKYLLVGCLPSSAGNCCITVTAASPLGLAPFGASGIPDLLTLSSHTLRFQLLPLEADQLIVLPITELILAFHPCDTPGTRQ